MNVPGKRLILGAAVAVAALGVGGIAYAATDDPAPEQGYVTIEEGATTPSPGTGSENGQQGNGTEGQGTPGSGSAGRNGADCPEKNGQGQGEQTQPSQPQTQPSQPEQTQPSQPSQPEQTQPDAAENA
ncbi:MULTISPECIES: hypothetical protein [unclassified Kribbella]|uniref:hypothetical protein n=1 Tax=unclassified Kribbella TaxID=2644121 RepID=UPI00301A7241